MSVSSRPRVSRRWSSLSAARRETFIGGDGQGASGSFGSAWPSSGRLSGRCGRVRCSRRTRRRRRSGRRTRGCCCARPSHCRNAVACLTCSAANPADAGCDVARLGAGPQPREDVPGREEPDRLGVLGVGDAGQVAGKPALEGAEVLVDRGQDSARHQEFFQVSGGPPGLELVEGVVGQRDLAEAEPPQQLRGACPAGRGACPARPARFWACPSPPAGRTAGPVRVGCGRCRRPGVR